MTFVSLCLTRVKRVDIFSNHFRNGMLPLSYLMLPPFVANLVKLGPEKISGERIIYHICQITDCCSRSGNCLIYTARHVLTKPICFLEQIYFLCSLHLLVSI